MRSLGSIASLIRSKNAGPFTLTIDIMFEHLEDFYHVTRLRCINQQFIATLYGVSPEKVTIHEYLPARSIKVSLPRRAISGSSGDSDVYGCQQYGPLLDLEIPPGL